MDFSQGEGPLRPEVRWGLGCLVAAAAVVGGLILTLLVAIALQPPAWIQVVLGIGLAVGGAILAWLVASALGQARVERTQRPPERHLRKL